MDTSSHTLITKVQNELKIKEKDGVIMQRGNYLRYCIIKDKTQKLGKPGEGQLILNIIGAVGHFYGTQLKLTKDKSGKSYNLDLPEVESAAEVLEKDMESGFDNRNIYDDGQSQSLSKDDIKQLVDSGKSGDEVIQTLMQNNKSFKSKTKYSQEKYVTKKQKKYVEYVTLHKPSIPYLAHLYYQQEPLKVSNMRIDTLSQILSYCNVQPGGNFAVYEAGTHGLVTASFSQRMGTRGALINVYSGDFPHKNSLEMLNFEDNQLKTLSFIAAEYLPNFAFKNEQEVKDFQTNLVQREEEEQSLLLSNRKRRLEEDESTSGETMNKKKKFVRPRNHDMVRAVRVLSEGLHGFVVACKQHPLSISLNLLSYLKPGHSFVIFSPYKEPLLDIYMEFKNQNCVNLRIIENWLRNYQVLPERTHPEVCMSGGGGYLLTGCKVSD